MICSILCACVMQAQSVEYINENIRGIAVNKTVMNNNGELIIAGLSGGNPSVMKMDTLGNVLWHKTFSGEPVRNNSHHQWHFWDLRTDDENNIYLYAEELKHARTPPRITKLEDSGELIWASADLPPAFEYEPNINTWLHVGDTALTISYMGETVSRVHLTSGEVLGKDSVLSSTWINARPSDMYYNGKQYRESGMGLLAFDKSGKYTIEPNPVNLPYSMRQIDSTGYYFLLRVYLDSAEREGRLLMLQKYDDKGELSIEKLVFSDRFFNNADSLSNFTGYGGYLFHPEKGILIYGNCHYILDNDSVVKGNWLAQIHPSDFEMLYDTVIDRPPQWGEVNFTYLNNLIYLQGYRSPGGRGAFVMKVNLKDVDEYPASSVAEKQEKTNTIKIYPNPSSSGEFIIQSKEKSISQIDVFTTTGQIIYSQKVNALQENIHMDTKGIYLVRVTTRDNRTETLKIVSQ